MDFMELMKLIDSRCSVYISGGRPSGRYIVRSYDERTSEIKTLYYAYGWKKAACIFEEEVAEVLGSYTGKDAEYVDDDDFEDVVVLSRQLTIPYEDGKYILVLGTVFGMDDAI